MSSQYRVSQSVVAGGGCRIELTAPQDKSHTTEQHVAKSVISVGL